MSHQSEAELETSLILQLKGLDYQLVNIHDEKSLLSNLKNQLEKLNKVKLSPTEFERVLLYLEKGNIWQKSKKLKERFSILTDKEEPLYLKIWDSDLSENNLYQVTHQITQEGTFKNRYDVTILINGLPIIQIELKRRGLELKEAFNQINRYQRHSFWTNRGLFQYVQIFVISNGGNTKYFANNRQQSFQFTFYWSDVNNKQFRDLEDFIKPFLNRPHVWKMVTNYVVQSETEKVLMTLRPYQYYASEAIIEQVKNKSTNGYIWHTTGSGKTLTSFKASQIIMNLPQVHKVIFVVDRNDLDYKTMIDFNEYKKDSVDVTNNTRALVNQLADGTKLVLTTIQKLNRAISKNRYSSKMEFLQDKKVVFIFDECHRSQFGDTHKKITEYFQNSQLFGFTGTPIFAENAFKNELGKRTTKDLFDECLHKYVITDAIRDQNVLKFQVDYIGKYRNKSKTFLDIEVEDIDKQEVYNSEKRLEKIVDFIISNHQAKTFNKQYSAILTASSIENAIAYYKLFKKKKLNGDHDLRFTTIYSYGANEDDKDAQGYYGGEEYNSETGEEETLPLSNHSRDELEEVLKDYNNLYGTNYSTKDSKSFEGFFKDISKRLKEREKVTFKDKDRLDILIVVYMFQTGFDAKKLNTLYVDRNLKYHGLIQAYSRTNRIINEQKSHGNIVCFRNLKKATDQAVTLFSNKEAIEEIFLPPYEKVAEKLTNAIASLKNLTPNYKNVDDLLTEDDELAFVKAFRTVLRSFNVINQFAEFSWDDFQMEEQEFENYKGKYLDLFRKVKNDHKKEKTSILDDIDFEVELLQRVIINVAYILKLLAELKSKKGDEAAKQQNQIMSLLSSTVELRSKKELIEKFIKENLPKIDNLDDIQDDFDIFWQEQKLLALGDLCTQENLDRTQFSKLVEAYLYSEQEPIREDIYGCLESRPSILKAREIGDRIISKMKNYVETYYLGMVG